MKARILMIAGFVLAAFPAMGQSQEMSKGESSFFDRVTAHNVPYLEKAVINYERGLKSGNDGVVEACITYSTFLRIGAPQLEMSKIQADLEEIAVSGRTPAIRYKAYLATIIFESPQAYRNALIAHYPDSNQFFSTVSGQVSRAVLVSTGN